MMTDQAPDCPAEYRWIKGEGEDAILFSGPVKIKSTPFFKDGEWRVFVQDCLNPDDPDFDTACERVTQAPPDELATLRADNARLSEEIERLKVEHNELEKRLTESIYGGRSIAFDPDEEIASLEAERDTLRQRLDEIREVLDGVSPQVDELLYWHETEPESREYKSALAIHQAIALLNETNETETDHG